MKNFLSKLLNKIGTFILRYGLGFIIIWLGFLKFKNSEADYTHQLISGGHISFILKYLTPYDFKPYCSLFTNSYRIFNITKTHIKITFILG